MYDKAERLLELVGMASGHGSGCTLDAVTKRFGVSFRTAQRMLHDLERMFPETRAHIDDEGRKHWVLRTNKVRDLLTLTSEEIAALDLVIAMLRRDGETVEAKKAHATQGEIARGCPGPKGGETRNRP